MPILKESNGSIEEQLQLRRVFRRLAFDYPLQRIDEKLQKLCDKLCSKHMQETGATTRSGSSLTDLEAKHTRYTNEKAKYTATLQDEAHHGKDLVTTKYHIDVTALQYVYERLGCSFAHSRTPIEELIWEINDSLDGAISFDEFERSYVRSRSDRTGLEPSEIFFLTCFLVFDKDCSGKIALDDALRIFYLKYGDAMEDEMELHFGKQVDEGAHSITFVEYRDSILTRTVQLVDQHAALAKTNKFVKRSKGQGA